MYGSSFVDAKVSRLRHIRNFNCEFRLNFSPEKRQGTTFSTVKSVVSEKMTYFDLQM